MICTRSSICVHVADVCDGVAQCPHGDDEHLCQLDFISCPHNCTCLNLAIQCANFTSTHGPAAFPWRYIKIHNSDLSSMLKDPNNFNTFHLVTFLNVSQSSIHSICKQNKPFPTIRTLLVLDLTKNEIHTLHSKCLGSSAIQEVYLGQNKVQKIGMHVFLRSHDMRVIDLSYNKIDHLNSAVFFGPIKLFFINLIANPIASIAQSAFLNVTMEFIVTNHLDVCCVKTQNSLCVYGARKELVSLPESCSLMIQSRAAKEYSRVRVPASPCETRGSESTSKDS